MLTIGETRHVFEPADTLGSPDMALKQSQREWRVGKLRTAVRPGHAGAVGASGRACYGRVKVGFSAERHLAMQGRSARLHTSSWQLQAPTSEVTL